ncbi:MAG TPA: DUF3224 domain-containing protein [Phycicoccus sp.]|jgi:hypothetical protein|nr:DUF3224 domain-containing protein [Phycicoccus sp.]HQY96549.1 DUF3224 domain-containing protein [Phycicoccus sp.]HRA45269.1 DUF3224 domain-containing protein [Phycicoccus sp.]
MTNPEIQHAVGTFSVALQPTEVEGTGVGVMTLSKTWSGDIVGTGDGVFASGGDPSTGTAGYVALEHIEGRIGDREGGFALQQYGQMVGGEADLTYAVVPGSGSGHLTGIAGTMELTIEDGVHTYDLAFTLPG